jgi:hypothetical protein
LVVLPLKEMEKFPVLFALKEEQEQYYINIYYPKSYQIIFIGTVGKKQDHFCKTRLMEKLMMK